MNGMSNRLPPTLIQEEISMTLHQWSVYTGKTLALLLFQQTSVILQRCIIYDKIQSSNSQRRLSL